VGQLLSNSELQEHICQANGLDKAKIKNEANAGMEELQTATQSIATKRIQRRVSQNIHDQMEKFSQLPC
jgi:hypothetical protein